MTMDTRTGPTGGARRVYARRPAAPLPDPTAFQREAFARFVCEGLATTLAETPPVRDMRGRVEVALSLPPDAFGRVGRDEEECRAGFHTYAVPLRVRATLTRLDINEVVEKTLSAGDAPTMTPRGTFIVRGVEWLPLAQIVRAPGPYYSIDDRDGRARFLLDLYPARGPKIRLESARDGSIATRIGDAAPLPVTALMRLFGLAGDDGADDVALRALGGAPDGAVARAIDATLAHDHSPDAAAAAAALITALRPGRPAPPAHEALGAARALFADPARYDLGRAGRHRLARRFGADAGAGRALEAADLVALTRRLALLAGGEVALDPLEDDVDHLANRRVRGVDELLQIAVRPAIDRVAALARDRLDRLRDGDIDGLTPARVVSPAPIAAALVSFFATHPLAQMLDEANPAHELAQKRRLTARGPGGVDRDRAGLSVRDVHRSQYGRLCPVETPEGPNVGLVPSLARHAVVDDLGFLRTPYRRVLTHLPAGDPRLIGQVLAADLPGAGGAPGARAGETISPALAAALTVIDPAREVRIRPIVSTEVVLLDAAEEARVTIAPATIEMDAAGRPAARVMARRGGMRVPSSPKDLDYVDVDPGQILSLITSLIPFANHNDPHRNVMGGNMIRQAEALVAPEAPLVGTGMEGSVARASSQLVLAHGPGVVVSASGRRVVVRGDDGRARAYHLRKARRSNQGTWVNQRPTVRRGDRIAAGDVVADAAGTVGGELALGKNLLCAFVAWRGGNYEDAILVRRGLVEEDALTSVRVDEIEVDVRRTDAGPERLARPAPAATGERDEARHLDARGVVHVGTTVRPGDILVAKRTPVLPRELTPEERLVAAIFDASPREPRETLTRLPKGKDGVIVGVHVAERADNPDLPGGVEARVTLLSAQKRRLVEGDKMAGRHGNKGVVSRIVPDEDMPFLPDGRPVDIVLNALGVPARMNPGQVLETHLGWAAEALGRPVATPVFDGASEEDVHAALREAGLPEDGKSVLFDGVTGEPFAQRVTVGVLYMMKLGHLVEDKAAARSTGPYSAVTRQPVKGKKLGGGQRAGEMEVWALEAHGAAAFLRETMTLRSDAPERGQVAAALEAGAPLPRPGRTATLDLLLRELEALCVLVEDVEGPDGPGVRARLATPDDVRARSCGAVTKADTIEPRLGAPARDGLFCERVFGPTVDYQCRCGKVSGSDRRGDVCPTCGVASLPSAVRRERMGHIDLGALVAHPWYARRTGSEHGTAIAVLLGLTPSAVARVLSYADPIVIDADRAALAAESEAARAAGAGARARLLAGLRPGAVAPLDALEDAAARRPGAVSWGWGARALRDLTRGLDLARIEREGEDAGAGGDGPPRARRDAGRRLELVRALRAAGTSPDALFIEALPVLPPDLRPILRMGDGRRAIADATELYRRVLLANDRLARLRSVGAPPMLERLAERAVCDAVWALFDNGRACRAVKDKGGRPFKSLSEGLRGKEGRFRKTLLGKRTDYSGRSMIIVNPDLRLHECGLPKRLALELMRPFVRRQLVRDGAAASIAAADKRIKAALHEPRRARPCDARGRPYAAGNAAVWKALSAVVEGRPVVLNRAPTLHRLSMMAFQPVLVEGMAIQIHPLVCSPYNADFDGDQMAVHIPLSPEAVLEARHLLLASRNILSPSDGEPTVAPQKDIVMGCYYLTRARLPAPAVEPPLFGDADEAIRAADAARVAHAALDPGHDPLDRAPGEPPAVAGSSGAGDPRPAWRADPPDAPRTPGRIGLHETVDVLIPDRVARATHADAPWYDLPWGRVPRASAIARGGALALRTTPGRLILNYALPRDVPYTNETLDKGKLRDLVGAVYRRCGPARTAIVADELKRLGFLYVTRSGVSMAIGDAPIPPEKADILARGNARVAAIDAAERRGMTSSERAYEERCAVWRGLKDEIEAATGAALDPEGPVHLMATSGSTKGGFTQIVQLTFWKGSVADTSGRVTDRPIEACLKEGLGPIEYVAATNGTRKGLADTAKGTARAGYFTRKMVEGAQEVVVRAEDCGTRAGLARGTAEAGVGVADPTRRRAAEARFLRRVTGRVAAEDARDRAGRTIVARGAEIGDAAARALLSAIASGSLAHVRVRSVMTCEAGEGVCRRCYGWDVATRRLVSMGVPVGVVAAQSIGEPGTQLVLRTFHTGGVGGGDITQGLPRIIELVEARRPTVRALVARASGIMGIEGEGARRTIAVRRDDGTSWTVPVPAGVAVLPEPGARVEAGDPLTPGAPWPNDILETRGLEAARAYLVGEIQAMYAQQGVEKDDRHVEVMVRQMTRHVRVTDPGGSGARLGAVLPRVEVARLNRDLVAVGRAPIEATPLVLAISAATMRGHSFLAVASFEKTTDALAVAALEGRVDHLTGIKERVIWGLTISAGTGPALQDSEEAVRGLLPRAGAGEPRWPWVGGGDATAAR